VFDLDLYFGEVKGKSIYWNKYLFCTFIEKKTAIIAYVYIESK